MTMAASLLSPLPHGYGPPPEGDPSSPPRTEAPVLDAWLARQALSFHWLPSRYAHSSHYEPLLPLPLRQRLSQTPRGEARLSRLLLTAHGLLGKWQNDFSQRSCRLALACSHLPRLARYAGAFFHAEALSRLIEKKRIAEIKSRIGADAYEFALRRGALFRKWRPLVPPNSGGDLAEEIERAGRFALGVCFSGSGPAVAGRLRLAWPAVDPLAIPSAQRQEAEAAGLFLARLLCQEIAPEWTSYLL